MNTEKLEIALKELAKAIFDQLRRGTLTLLELGDNTVTVEVVFDYHDEIVLLKTLRPVLKPFGVIDVWCDKFSTTVTYNFRLKPDPTEDQKVTLKQELERCFLEE